MRTTEAKRGVDCRLLAVLAIKIGWRFWLSGAPRALFPIRIVPCLCNKRVGKFLYPTNPICYNRMHRTCI